MNFKWIEYNSSMSSLVDSWLDEKAVRGTGLDESFDVYCHYWKNKTDSERGESFWCKLVSEDRHPFAAVAFRCFQHTVTVMEIIIAPAMRGQGKGTAVIKELVENAADWIGQPVSSFDAVIDPDNTASQVSFYKAGFVPDISKKDRWVYAAQPSEILFRYVFDGTPRTPDWMIRWLNPDDRSVFNAHLLLSLQKPLSGKRWNSILNAGIFYCGLFSEDRMVARACIEKLTDRYWEISDVRVVPVCRNRGYATAICSFVINEILESGRIPTIRTERNNAAMRRVIQKLGFLPFAENANGNGTI